MSHAPPVVSRLRARSHKTAERKLRLPRGGGLPADEFEHRHALLLVVLWISAFVLPVISVAEGWNGLHATLHSVPVAAFAAVATLHTLSKRLRAVACSLGLLTAAALLVHTWHGLIEGHFAFFVLIVALTLYEDWAIFGLAVVFVLVHHGGLGALYPSEVYSGPSLTTGSVWGWSALHASFIAASGAAAIVLWNHNEKVRRQLHAAVLEQHRLVEVLRDHAHRDALTGLSNRRAWDERLVEEVRRAGRSGQPLSLAVLDFDHFKELNDSQGHQAGDRLLVDAAAHWALAIRETDFLARIGGDEFGVLCPGCSEDAAQEVVARMRSASPAGGGFSAGIARWDGCESPTRLVRRADAQLYEAKAQGRGGTSSAAGLGKAEQGGDGGSRRLREVAPLTATSMNGARDERRSPAAT